MTDNDRQLAANLDKEIRSLLEATRTELPGHSVEWVEDYLDHYELGLAGETLLEGIDEAGILARNPDLTAAVSHLRLTLFPEQDATS